MRSRPVDYRDPPGATAQISDEARSGGFKDNRPRQFRFYSARQNQHPALALQGRCAIGTALTTQLCDSK
jgi:hypothetical protein